MTREEQVALYQQGVEAWNAWRKENPDDGSSSKQCGTPARPQVST